MNSYVIESAFSDGSQVWLRQLLDLLRTELILSYPGVGGPPNSLEALFMFRNISHTINCFRVGLGRENSLGVKSIHYRVRLKVANGVA